MGLILSVELSDSTPVTESMLRFGTMNPGFIIYEFLT